MGTVRWGAPTELISKLREACGIRTFVETGTFAGATAYWASQEFESVFSIEMSDHYHSQAVRRYGQCERIKFIKGDSREQLIEIVRGCASPIMFWLDAHWSGGMTAGSENQCPLLDELRVINENTNDAYVLVDDARIFLAPIREPADAHHWPDIVQVLEALAPHRYNRFVAVFEDVIIAVPEAAKQALAQYCHEVSERDEAQSEKRPSLIERGVKGVRSLFQK
jgi:hypothetical protein